MVLRQNFILNAVNEDVRNRALHKSALVSLAFREVVHEPDEPIRHVYFPIDGVLTVVVQMGDGLELEIATIGREGMSPLQLLMGGTKAGNLCFCEVRGTAIRVPVSDFHALVAADPALTYVLERYVQTRLNVLGQLAACNRLHNVYQRCARWLLLTCDRVNANEFPVTHEFLASMLGTRRSGVSDAAAALQAAGCIRYARGIVRITDRSGLESAACECYSLIRTQFLKLQQATRRLSV